MKNPINSIKEKITHYIQLRYEDLRLEVIERLSNIMGYLVFILSTFFLFSVGFIFLGFGLAEWLSKLFGSRAAGYFSTSGIFLIAAVILILTGKRIAQYFANKMVGLLSAPKQDDDASGETTDN